MNKLQTLLYNNGERLVPYVSHDDSELVRHRSSYAFFHEVIAHDLIFIPEVSAKKIKIADLGFGTGYGCTLLSSLKNVQVTGVDIANECEIFARQYYPRTNVDYVIQDLTQFIPGMSHYDYVVSRGVLEHVPHGLELIKAIKYHRRVIIDVPYDENPGNEHHVLTGIREEDFAHLGACELFYEDMDGAIYDAATKPEKSNMIAVVISAPDLPKVADFLRFPIAAITSQALEVAGQATMSGSRTEFDTPEELLLSVEKAIKETEVVADIGCGIMPMNYFRPKLHLLIEPWKQYADILSYRNAGDKSVIVLRQGALEALLSFSDNSVDSIFLLDVIEHIEKDEGVKIITECERVAREQVIIFTPMGFMPQHMDTNEHDGWGLDGTEVQEHRSGWLPEDFSAAWSFYICRKFHRVDFKGMPLEKTYGAFFAIRHFEEKSIPLPPQLPDLRRPLPAEFALQILQNDFARLQAECVDLKHQLNAKQVIWATHESSLKQFENQLNARHSILDAHEIALTQKQQQVENRQAILDEHLAALKQREATLNNKHVILDAHEAGLKLLAEQLSEKQLHGS